MTSPFVRVRSAIPWGGRTPRAKTILIALACSALAWGALRELSAKLGEPPSAKIPEQRVAAARVEPIEDLVRASGIVNAQAVEIRPARAGKLEQAYVRSGEPIEEGALLAVLDTRSLRAKVAEAEGRLAAASAERDLAERRRERTASLFERRIASAQAIEVAKAEASIASARWREAKAALLALEIELEQSHVRAPVSGVVIGPVQPVGSFVSSDASVTALMKILDPKTLHLVAEVDENAISRVRVGQLVRITTDSYGPGETFTGTVERLALEGIRKGNITYFEVFIDVSDEARARLRPKMSAEAQIVIEQLSDAVTVPDIAVRFTGNQPQVDVVDPSTRRTERRDVSLGPIQTDRVVVRKGLSAGEIVLLP